MLRHYASPKQLYLPIDTHYIPEGFDLHKQLSKTRNN